MKSIGDFLGRAKKITDQGLLINAATQNVLKKNLSIDISSKDIRFKGETLYFKISGAGRAEIVIKQKEIIEEINKYLGKNVVSKIS